MEQKSDFKVAITECYRSAYQLRIEYLNSESVLKARDYQLKSQLRLRQKGRALRSSALEAFPVI